MRPRVSSCLLLAAWMTAACGSTGASPRATPDAGDAGADTTAPPASDSGSVQPVDATADGADGDTGSGADAGGSTDGGCSGVVPLTYAAATDRLPHQVSPPTLGAAGTIVKDPVYGTSLSRVTDVQTVAGANLSYRVANEFWGNDWNTDATLFYLQDSKGTYLLYNFDPTTLAATPVMDMSKPGSPLAMPIFGGGFSRTQANILYGLKGLTVAQFDFSVQKETPLVDLTTIVAGVAGNALGVQQGANGLLATAFGGPAQDEMPYIVTYDPATSAHHVLNLPQSTLDGSPVGATIGGGVHTFRMDASGRYVAFASAATSGTTNWAWDTTANTVTSVPSSGAFGWQAWLRPGSVHEAYQWEVTTFAAPSVATTVVTPLLTPADTLASSSASWQNATSGPLTPVIIETMRQPADNGPWRAWDDELLAVRTDGVLVPSDGGMQSIVWRFAHTFNSYTGTIYSDNFYYLFIPRVSQNGWFVLFDSNWNGTLGTDSMGNPRTDAFVAALPNACGP